MDGVVMNLFHSRTLPLRSSYRVVTSLFWSEKWRFVYFTVFGQSILGQI